MQPWRHEIDDVMSPPRTVWTRGKGCADLARAVAGELAVRARGELIDTCIESRAQLLVTKRIPSAAPLPSATPIDFAPEGATSVVALVSGGPHSLLAARVASWIGETLGMPAELVSGYRVPDERDQAVEVIDHIAHEVPDLEARTVEAWTAKQLLEEMDDDALLVFGAAGGSWIQRMFLGPGARLAASAPAGAVVVRDREPLVFTLMDEPAYVSPLLLASDALLASEYRAIPVVAFGRLAGVVRRAVLEAADRGARVESLMEPPLCVSPTDPAERIAEIHRRTGMDPVPVCGDDGLLVGVVRAFD